MEEDLSEVLSTVRLFELFFFQRVCKVDVSVVFVAE